MKQNTVIALITLNLISFPAFSEIKEPSYPLSKDAMISLMGSADALRITGDFTCENLLAKTWPYPASNAVISLCWNAEQSCYAYIILRDQIRAKQDKNPNYETSLKSSRDDAQFRLASCLTAIDSALLGKGDALPQLGHYQSPLLNLTPVPPAPSIPLR